MDENGKFILNTDCLLEIMKFVIRLYHDLRMRLACRIAKMLIELRVNKISSQNRHLFWRSYLQSIKERFSFDIELDFVQHKYERSVYLTAVSKDLIHTEISKLNVNITAEALMDICQSYPNLRKLSLQNIEIHGSISDITAYCGNLRELRITLNPEVKAAQYAPLAKLPNLTTFIISGVQEVGSIDLFFADMRRWHRPRSLQPLTVTIKDKIFKSPSVTFAAFNSLRYLKIYQYYKYNSEWDINFTAEYDLNDLSEDGNSINGSLATISVGQLVGLVFDRCKEEIVLTIDKISDIRKLGSLSKLPNFNSLLIRTDSCDVPFNQSKLQNLFRSLASNESIALKSCIIRNILLDRVGALELASITSIRFLKCELSEWRSVQFLSQLYNLEYLKINVHDSVDASTSRLVTYLLSTCQFDTDNNYPKR
ncbi:uncharacterized protein LOC108110152 [Drosophila eugracilis]|uniref:uncharacterized protein LOC108110152 n=1 Tax=Drosophila eugracilis TaxID=29029 RepID=UPI001BD93F7A|nr:uncharacterized protein LOC108110152 [Drosophila eugracilis]